MKLFLVIFLLFLSFICSHKLMSKKLSMSSNNGQIFVCTNRWCREKGSDATIATFQFLSPSSIPITNVKCLGRCNKGPNVRILSSGEGKFVEASMVRSVESVVNLLQTHLNVDVNMTSAETLRLNYEGNILLRNGQVDDAIECYNKALSLGDQDQEGVLLVMRGTALLQRAYACRLRHRDMLNIAENVLPTFEPVYTTIQTLLLSTSTSSISQASKDFMILNLLLKVNSIYESLDTSSRWVSLKSTWPIDREGTPTAFSSGKKLLDRLIFTYNLYEHALSTSMRDLLAATVVLPGFAQAWRRVGDALTELRRYDTAVRYYEMAIKLDPLLQSGLSPVIERLRMKEKLVEEAGAKGWPTEAVFSLLEDV